MIWKRAILAAAVAVSTSPALAQSGERVWDVTRQCWRPAEQQTCGASWDAGSETLKTGGNGSAGGGNGSAQAASVSAPNEPDSPTVESPESAQTGQTGNQANDPAEAVAEKAAQRADQLRSLMESGQSLQNALDSLREAAGQGGGSESP
ncbi:hypothetical protein SAMN05216241_102232 [Limimonas halophila]|uniref:Uncharacterized protein n=1 Tax=Limimonas halophila TaxID=1082479 RepID=A0A1G7NMU4_9PROT|nr:hypothetical protein [Limimonas halophila]SDF75384.1 hypothetical protein SAMN05216241_102232 [Limimonas halophila]